MDQAPSSFPCTLLGGGQAVLHLRCEAPFDVPGISAFLNGIEIGHLPLAAPPHPGDRLQLRLTRLPRVPLPAEIRLGIAGRDLAAAIPITTAADAVALYGPGLWQAENLALRHGLLHGVLRNADNALAEPRPFARVNAGLSRPLLLGQPATLPDGAALWPFQLPLQAEDLLEAGLILALHVATQEAPLATLAWSRAGAEALDQRLIALEAQLAEAVQAHTAGLAQLAAEQRRLHQEQRARIDAFIEYAGALLLDRVAATSSALGSAAAGDDGLGALRALIAGAAPLPAGAGTPAVAGGMVLPGSALFSFGWHQLERDAGGEFRWMGATASVGNPSPQQSVAEVLMHVRHVHGAERPLLTATLDGAAATTTLEGEGPADWRLRITPAGPVPCRTLRLASPHHASPAELGISPDARPLSVAVSRVEFLFFE